MKWTKEEIEEAKRLVEQGLHYNNIGEILERTSDSVRGKLSKLGYNFFKLNSRVETRQCRNCLRDIQTTKGSKKRFCSQSCSAKYNNKKRKKINKCQFCGQDILTKSRYCGNHCHTLDYQNKVFKKIEEGDCFLYEGQYKKYLIHKYGNQCMECGWNKIHPTTGKVPIQLEHINGNSEDNSLNNLKLLCPNCHSLTLTFGALNKGNGCEKRRIKRQAGVAPT